MDARVLLALFAFGFYSCYAAIEPFHLSQVKLFDSTIHAKAASLNKKYLFLLDPDRLLHSFRLNARLPTTAAPYVGSWEEPTCEIRGHFVGHYLSALAFAHANLGNATIKARLDYMVVELKKVQDALGNGYLSAFPSEHFDRLESLKAVWAPYYVIHKIMLGLLDAYTLTGNQLALNMTSDMANYFLARSEKVIAASGVQYWNAILNNEFGGMNEVLYNLYTITKSPGHLRLAQLFDKPSFLNPLLKNQDPLPTLHANTHLAQVVGFAARYDATQDPSAMKAVENFFAIVTDHHSYATGGNNVNERWYNPDTVADAIVDPRDSLGTQETCTQYNMLKIARSMFRWSGQATIADYYERAMLNGIIGVTRLSPADVNSQVKARPTHAGHHHHLHLHRRNAHEEVHDEEESLQHQHQIFQRMHNHELGDMDADIMGQAVTSGNLKSYATTEDLAVQDSTQTRRGHNLEKKATGSAGVQVAVEGEQKSNASLAAGHSSLLLSHGLATVPVVERYRPHFYMDFPGFGAPPPGSVNGVGEPGVFLYLLPLGTGQSKADNYHGWGTQEHSFWCCYGTAIESFAKLTDSIFFKDMNTSDAVPRLYLVQLTSSRLTWKELNMVIDMKASYYADGRTANVTLLIKKVTGPTKEVPFNMMFRVPNWTKAAAVKLQVNGQDWRNCPGKATAGSFCQIKRGWKQGDKVFAVLPMKMALRQVQDNRPAMQSLHAIMMGPFVMAGLTHDNRLLMVDQEHLEEATTEPDPDGLASIQAGWDPTVFIRHDHYHVYLSRSQDSGDAIDGTFRIIQGCHGSHDHLVTEADITADVTPSMMAADSAEGTKEAVASKLEDATDHDKLANNFEAVKTKMRLGMHDDVSISMESMNMPGFFLGVDMAGTMVLEQDDGSPDFCDSHTFFLRPGLDGAPETMSLEASFNPGYFITGYKTEPAECEDFDGQACQEMARRGMCVRDPGSALVNCRVSCGTCSLTTTALQLQPRQVDNPSWAAASSFRMTDPLAPRYPPGSKVISGTNRKYVVSPLGNLVDERYTVYFEVAKAGEAVVMGSSGLESEDDIGTY